MSTQTILKGMYNDEAKRRYRKTFSKLDTIQKIIVRDRVIENIKKMTKALKRRRK